MAELADGICLRAGRVAAGQAELLVWIGESAQTLPPEHTDDRMQLGYAVTPCSRTPPRERVRSRPACRNSATDGELPLATAASPRETP